MKIQAIGFSNNGRGDLRGTLVALDDNDEPLGFEHTANFSDLRERRQFVGGLVTELGVAEDRARMAVAQAIKEVRRSWAEAGGLEDDEVTPLSHERTRVVVTNRYLREITDDSWGLLKEANRKEQTFFRYGEILAVILVVVGLVLTPLVFDQTATARANANIGYFTGTQSILDLIPLLYVVGVLGLAGFVTVVTIRGGRD